MFNECKTEEELQVAYEEANAPLWAAYEEANAPLWAAYQAQLKILVESKL